MPICLKIYDEIDKSSFCLGSRSTCNNSNLSWSEQHELPSDHQIAESSPPTSAALIRLSDQLVSGGI